MAFWLGCCSGQAAVVCSSCELHCIGNSYKPVTSLVVTYKFSKSILGILGFDVGSSFAKSIVDSIHIL